MCNMLDGFVAVEIIFVNAHVTNRHAQHKYFGILRLGETIIIAIQASGSLAMFFRSIAKLLI